LSGCIEDVIDTGRNVVLAHFVPPGSFFLIQYKIEISNNLIIYLIIREIPKCFVLIGIEADVFA
jgi:hypothetical protein